MRTASRGFVTWIYARDVYARIAPFLCVYYVRECMRVRVCVCVALWDTVGQTRKFNNVQEKGKQTTFSRCVF